MIKSQSTYYFYGVGLLFAFLGYLIYKKLTQKPSKEVVLTLFSIFSLQLRKKDWKKDVVYLFQYKRPPRMANISPYCMKVEMFLRINDIPYEVGHISLWLSYCDSRILSPIRIAPNMAFFPSSN